MDSFNKHTIHFSKINKEQHQKNHQQREAFSCLFFFSLKTEMKFLGTVLGIIEDTEAIG